MKNTTKKNTPFHITITRNNEVVVDCDSNGILAVISAKEDRKTSSRKSDRRIAYEISRIGRR